MAGQPLLTDRSKFECTVRPVPAGRQRDDRHEQQQNSYRDGNSKGIDHGLNNIRPYAAGRK